MNIEAIRSLVNAKKQKNRTKQSNARPASSPKVDKATALRMKISRAEKIADLSDKYGQVLIRVGTEGVVKTSMESVNYMDKSPNDINASGSSGKTPVVPDSKKVTTEQLGKMEPAGEGGLRDGVNPVIADDTGKSMSGDDTPGTISKGIIENTNADPATGKIPQFEEKVSPDQDVDAIITKMSAAGPDYFRKKMSGVEIVLDADDRKALSRMKVRTSDDALRVFVKSSRARGVSVDTYIDELSINDPETYGFIKQAMDMGAIGADEIMIAKEGVQDIVRAKQELPDPATVAQMKGVSVDAGEVAVVETAALIEAVGGQVAPEGMGGAASAVGGNINVMAGAPAPVDAPPIMPAAPPVAPPAAPPMAPMAADPSLDPAASAPPAPAPGPAGGQMVQASVDFQKGNLFDLMGLLRREKESALSDVIEEPTVKEDNVVNPENHTAGGSGTQNQAPKDSTDTSTISDPSPDQSLAEGSTGAVIEAGPEDLKTQAKEKAVAAMTSGVAGASKSGEEALNELDTSGDTDVQVVGEEFNTKASAVENQLNSLFPGRR